MKGGPIGCKSEVTAECRHCRFPRVGSAVVSHAVMSEPQTGSVSSGRGVVSCGSLAVHCGCETAEVAPRHTAAVT